jgi:hypothetical protein
VLDERVAHRRHARVLDGERHHVVLVAAPDGRARLDLDHLDREAHAVAAERHRLAQHARRAARAPQPQHLRAPLELQRAREPHDAEQVVGVRVREEDVGEGERHAVAHHLPLRPLAAVDEDRLALAHHGDRRDVALTVGRLAAVPRKRRVSDMAGKIRGGPAAGAGRGGLAAWPWGCRSPRSEPITPRCPCVRAV